MNLRRPAIALIGLVSVFDGALADASSDPKITLKQKPPQVFAMMDGNHLELIANKVLGYMDHHDKPGLVNYVLELERSASDPDGCDETLREIVTTKKNKGIVLIDGQPIATFKPNDPNAELEVYDRVAYEQMNHCNNTPKRITPHHRDGDDAIATAVTVFQLWRNDRSHDHDLTLHYIADLDNNAHYPSACRNELALIIQLSDNPESHIKYVDDKPVEIVTTQDGKTKELLLSSVKAQGYCVSGINTANQESTIMATGFISRLEGDLREAYVASVNKVLKNGIHYQAGEHIDPAAEIKFNNYWTPETQMQATSHPQCANDLNQVFIRVKSLVTGAESMTPEARANAIQKLIEVTSERDFAPDGQCMVPAAPHP